MPPPEKSRQAKSRAKNITGGGTYLSTDLSKKATDDLAHVMQRDRLTKRAAVEASLDFNAALGSKPKLNERAPELVVPQPADD